MTEVQPVPSGSSSAAHGREEDRTRPDGVQGAHFHHEALFYAGDDQFLQGTLPFIAGALANDEPVLAVLPGERTALLRESLGDSAGRVRFEDMHQLGRNPARIIPAWREFLDDCGGEGRPVRGIGEPVWPGRSEAELGECERHESLLNLAFDSGQAWRLLCTYDRDRLGEPVIAAACRNHPFIAQDGGSSRSAEYLDSSRAPDPFAGELPPAPNTAEEMPFVREELKFLRAWVSGWAAHAPLGSERVEELVLAVSELASNSVCYGGGKGILRMWTEPRELVCEVSDGGSIRQPLVGRIRPTSDQYTGRGLWLVNHLCDLVQIRSTPAGTAIRLHVTLP